MKLDKEDKVIPRLSAFIAAIFNWDEKNLLYLPCENGYLVFHQAHKKEDSLLLWVHRLTVETTMNVVFNIAQNVAQDFIFSLILGGQVLKNIIKSKYPPVPTQTLFFLPKSHMLEYGTVTFTKDGGIISRGADILAKGFSSATTVVSRTGQGIAKRFSSKDSSQAESNTQEELELVDSDSFLDRTYVYIHTIDTLYYHLSKEIKFIDKLPPSSGGYEYRSIFIDEAAHFLDSLKNSGFKLTFTGEKAILGL